MLDFIAFTEHDKSHQKLYDYTANLSGDPLSTCRPVRSAFAVGYEHRHQSAYLHARSDRLGRPRR